MRFAWRAVGPASPDQRCSLLFRRDFRGPSGGHLKVWHYFRHAARSRRYRPLVYFTPESVRGTGNPWNEGGPEPLSRWEPDTAGGLFLAGLDWEAVPPTTRTPVVNLIQGLRHAEAGDPRRRFLSRPATRICVSPEVADAIASTGEVNGPIITIPVGLDASELPPVAVDRDVDLVVAGLKNPAFARAIAERFGRAGLRVKAPLHPLPRREFLDLFGRARVAVTLPFEQEGFFLPALEAMAMGAVVVCPDCVGNRSFCLDGVTCLRPAYRAEAIMAAVDAAVSMPEAIHATLRGAAAEQVRRHSIERECESFLRILDGLAPGS